MKKYFMILSLFVSFFVCANQGWPRVSSEEAERQKIYMQIARVREQLTALGGGARGSAEQRVIVQLLRDIGTPVSYKILQELVARGEINKSYLQGR